MVRMLHKRTVKIAIIAAALLLAAYFIPQYRAVPTGGTAILQTSGDGAQALQIAEQSARAEIAAVQASAAAGQAQQLALITEPDDGVGVVRAAIASAAKSLDLVIYEL